MGEARYVLETEHAARALNRMRGAENPVEEFGVEGALIQAQKSGFHFRQMFGGLLEKRFAKTIEVYLHGRFLSISRQDPGDGLKQLFGMERLHQPSGGAGRLALLLL